jgi:hypothetical protein
LAPQRAMKIAVTAPAAIRAQSKGQQGPGRRSTIANFDQLFCVYVLCPPQLQHQPIRCYQTSDIRRSPRLALRIWHFLLPSTRARNKGQPGGQPSRISTSRFVCTCFAPPPQLQHQPIRCDQKFVEAPRLALRI